MTYQIDENIKWVFVSCDKNPMRWVFLLYVILAQSKVRRKFEESLSLLVQAHIGLYAMIKLYQKSNNYIKD